MIVQIPENSEIYNREIPTFNSKEEQLRFLSKKFVYHLNDGKVVGRHQGAHYFTIGQRKGLNVGGTKEALEKKKATIAAGEGEAGRDLAGRQSSRSVSALRTLDSRGVPML